MGQCAQSPRHEDVASMEGASLDKVKNRSSNAALTSVRYHVQRERPLSRDYEVDGEVLGQGMCGNVVLARSRVDSRLYALKHISKTSVSAGNLKELTSEVAIYLTLDHPNVARLHDVYESANQLALLTEYCAGGELYSRLEKFGVYSDAGAAQATREMLRAVAYLHSHNVVHRDLKLENFLYESEDASAQLKLIDFGFAKWWDPSTLMMAACGSIAYVSPDVLNGAGYTNKCDLWSLGVIVWMLLVGYPPFHGEEKLMKQQIKAGRVDWNHASRWCHVSDSALHFVHSLLVLDPCQRPSAQEALRHPWVLAPTASTTPVLSTAVLRSLQQYTETTKVRRAVLQLLAQELAPDETRDLTDMFIALDTRHCGTVSFNDLKEAIRAGPRSPRRRPRSEVRTPSSRLETQTNSPSSAVSLSDPGSPTTSAWQMPSCVLDELFGMLDANGNEEIHYLDFLAATLETKGRLREETARVAFERLDADQSGRISISDLQSTFRDSFDGITLDDLLAEASLDVDKGIDFPTFQRVLENRDHTSCGSDHTFLDGCKSPNLTRSSITWLRGG